MIRAFAPASAVVFALLAPVVVVSACGPSANRLDRSTAPKAMGSKEFKGATRCDTTGPGREVSYHDLANRGKPDMIEVIAYSKGASGYSEGRIICMELDTNHDGVLDLLRVFGDKGELESEEADRNYDGKSDAWITYEKGVLSKQAFDNTFSRGIPDETDYYRDGKLKRIERDRNGDGKTDVWEFYVNGRLERMGVDLDFSGRVTVWYRDEVARTEQKKIAAATAASAAAAASASAAPSASGKRKEAL